MCRVTYVFDLCVQCSGANLGQIFLSHLQMSQLIICFTIASYFRFVHNVFSFIIPFLAVVAMLVHNTSSDYNNN